MPSLLQNLALNSATDNNHRLLNMPPIEDLPADYKNLMTQFDGGAGFLNDRNSSYLDLWPLAFVCENNPYSDDAFSKQVIIIGSNGSGMLFGYDLLNHFFFTTDEYQMNSHELTKLGSGFHPFIESIASLPLWDQPED